MKRQNKQKAVPKLTAYLSEKRNRHNFTYSILSNGEHGYCIDGRLIQLPCVIFPRLNNKGRNCDKTKDWMWD